MTSKSTAVEAPSQYRLPKTAIPSYYNIRIEPDMVGGKHFSGTQQVHLKITAPVSELVLNAAEMEISEVVLCDHSGTRLLGKAVVDNTTERATIAFDGVVGPGDWTLELKFVGTFNEKLKGFYLSRYKNAAGQEEVIATTKFEPCDARRAFPCWDEPAFKARFKISLVIDKNLKAVSNGRLLQEKELPNNKKLLEFAPSIVMSSYLVAYVIGNLECSEPVYSQDGVPISVWTVPGKSKLGAFALSAAAFSLDYFHRYFKTPYPGDKLDLVAIPDFASGAMENFACITFRETALLVNPETASHAELERVAEVVMHENAHMWFGDYTTMTWWNGLWLNEAFATFMAAKALDAWKPDWKIWDGFSIQRGVAMRTDGLCETRPIEFPVNNPDEARGMFDVLTYQKGCAILRMLELFLGEDAFQKGIITYLEKHALGNADTPDLWAALEVVSPRLVGGVTVTDLMNTWVYQPGYPALSVEESPVTGSITVKQQLFRYLKGERPNKLWHVPVHVRAIVNGDDGKSTTVEHVFLLSKPSQTFYVGENMTACIVNAGGHGFYRVQYDQKLRQKLLDNLGTLTAGERFNLVSDLWASVQSGQTSVRDYLALVGILTCVNGEFDINVFSVINASLNTLRRIAANDEDNATALCNLARDFTGSALNRLTLTPKAGEPAQDSQLRGMLLSLLGTLGDTAVITWARKAYGRYKADKSAVDTNLVGAMVETLAAHGDEYQYEDFAARKDAAATPQEEQRFLFALASFRDNQLAGRTLASCIDGTVRTQDAPYLVRNVLMNTFTARRAFDFVTQNWDLMTKLYPGSGMSRMCEAITTMVGDDVADDARAFFADHTVKGGEKAIRQYMEQLSIALALKKRERGELQDLLLGAYLDAI